MFGQSVWLVPIFFCTVSNNPTLKKSFERKHEPEWSCDTHVWCIHWLLFWITSSSTRSLYWRASQCGASGHLHQKSSQNGGGSITQQRLSSKGAHKLGDRHIFSFRLFTMYCTIFSFFFWDAEWPVVDYLTARWRAINVWHVTRMWNVFAFLWLLPPHR